MAKKSFSKMARKEYCEEVAVDKKPFGQPGAEVTSPSPSSSCSAGSTRAETVRHLKKESSCKYAGMMKSLEEETKQRLKAEQKAANLEKLVKKLIGTSTHPSKSLRNHLNYMTEYPRYRCKICEHCFLYRCYLVKHLKRAHKLEADSDLVKSRSTKSAQGERPGGTIKSRMERASKRACKIERDDDGVESESTQNITNLHPTS